MCACTQNCVCADESVSLHLAQTHFKRECVLQMTDRCDSVTTLQAPADNPCFLPLIKALCSINLTPAAVLHHSTLKSSLK